MHTFLVGCGQITWPRDMSDEQVLAEIALAGYAGAPFSPRGAESASDAVARFARHGLRPAPGYFGGDFWKPELHDQLVAEAHRQAQIAAAAGLTEIYISAGGFGGYTTARGLTRAQASGHVRPEDAMTEAEWQQCATTLNAIGAATLGYGVRCCYHNHVGSVIETLDEMERLLALLDPALIFLGPDTGHLAWGGADAVAFCRQYADRIKTIHLKDVNPAVVAASRANEWDYGTAQSHGVWTELGQGAIDFGAILGALRDAEFNGWVIVETDVTQLPSALESAQVSRRYLQQLGI